MRIFRKRKRAIHTGPTLTERLGRYLDSRQRKLANYLNGKVKTIPKQRLKHGLIAFCLLASAYLIWLMAGAF